MSQYWKRGKVSYPLTAATDNSLLEDCDPALYDLLRFLSTTLNADIGDRLRNEAAKFDISIPVAVAQTLHLAPMPVLLAHQYTFPLLAIHRKTESESEHVVAHLTDVGEFEFDYVLPSMGPAAQVALTPILRSVARSISRWVDIGQHPDFEDERNIWADANVQKARVRDIKYGGYAALDEDLGDSGFYRGVTGTIEIRERDMPDDRATELYDGVLAHVDSASQTEETYEDMAVFATYPIVNTATPSLGAAGGGTAVTIRGANFEDESTVQFGANAATSVVYLNANTITCVTPAGTGVVDVTVTLPDGRIGRLPMGFSYS